MFMLTRATLLTATLAVFAFTSFAEAQSEKIKPFRKAGDWVIEFVPATRSTIRHCRAQRSYGNDEEMLVVLAGPKYFAIDFAGIGGQGLGQEVELTYTFTPPGTPYDAKARLVPNEHGFQLLRLVEFVDEVGHEDELENSKRLEIRTKRPPANGIKGRWMFDLKGANRAMKVLYECRDKMVNASNTPAQSAPQQTATPDTTLRTATAPAKNWKFKTVGQWKILSIDEKGKFHRCAAEQVSNSGMLRIAHFPSRSYNFSIPCHGRTKIDGELIVHAGDELGRLKMKSVNSGDNCRIVTQALDNSWVDQLKEGGDLTVELGKDRLKWSLAGAKTAMATLKGCVAER